MEETTTYEVRIIGCDADTEISIDLTEDGLKVARELERLVNVAAKMNCQPSMEIKKK
jgi:hypothetical protein